MDLETDEYNHLGPALEAGDSYTLLHEGIVLLCGGVMPYKNGNAEIWLLPSVHFAKHRFMGRVVKGEMLAARKRHGLKRMQTVCKDNSVLERWMSFLGFEKEGVMRKYHHGSDHCMWGRVWE